MAKNIKQQIDITARNKTKSGFRDATKDANVFARSIKRIQTSVIGIFAFRIAESFRVGIGSIIGMSDSIIELDAKMKLATETTNEMADAEQRLVDISLKTGSSLLENSNLFAKLNRPVKALGFEYGETLKITDALSKSLRISGATTNQTASATLQFTQALESGIVAGDEYRSLNENAPRLMQAVADSLGITRGELRALSKEQKLTADVVIPAILDQYSTLSDEAAGLPLTIGRAWQNLITELRILFKESGEMNSGVASAIQSVAGVVKILTENLALLGFAFSAVIVSASLHFLDSIKTKLLANLALKKQEIVNTDKARRADNRRASEKAVADLAAKKASFEKAEASVIEQENILRERSALIAKSEASTKEAVSAKRRAVIDAKAHLEKVKASEAERKQNLLLSNAKTTLHKKTVLENTEAKIAANSTRLGTQDQVLAEVNLSNQRKLHHSEQKIRTAEELLSQNKKLIKTRELALSEATTDKQKEALVAKINKAKIAQIGLENKLELANTKRANVEVANASRLDVVNAKTKKLKLSEIALNNKLKLDSEALAASEIANTKKLEKLVISSKKRVVAAEKSVEAARRQVVRAAKVGATDIQSINNKMIASEKALEAAIVKRFATEEKLRLANSVGRKTEAAVIASNLAARTTGLQKMGSAIGLVTKAEKDGLKGTKLFRAGFKQTKGDIANFVRGLGKAKNSTNLLTGGIKLLGNTAKSSFAFLFGLPGLFILAMSPFLGKLFDVEVAWIALTSTIKRTLAEVVTFLASFFQIANLQDWLATVNTAEQDLDKLREDRKAKELGFLDHADRMANELNKLKDSEVVTMSDISKQETLILDQRLKANQDYLDQKKAIIDNDFAQQELALRLSLLDLSMSEEDFATESAIRTKQLNDQKALAQFEHSEEELKLLDEFYIAQIERAEKQGKSTLRLRTKRNEAIRDKSKEIVEQQIADLDRLEDNYDFHVKRMNRFDDRRASYKKSAVDFINGLNDSQSLKEKSVGDITLEVSESIRKLGELDTIDKEQNAEKVFKIYDDTITSLKAQAQEASNLAKSVEKGSVKEADALDAKRFAVDALKRVTDDASQAAKDLSAFEKSQVDAVKGQINDRAEALRIYRQDIIELDKIITLQRNIIVDLKIDPAMSKLERLEQKLIDIQRRASEIETRDGSTSPSRTTIITAPELPQRAEGGGFKRIKGKVPGTGSGDKIKALLEPEEFVINKKAVRGYGTGFFQSVNDSIPRFQFGGSVGGDHNEKVAIRIDAMKESYLSRVSEWKGVYDRTGEIEDYNKWQSVKMRVDNMVSQLGDASDIGLEGLRRLHVLNGDILNLATTRVVSEMSLVNDSRGAGGESGIGNTAFVASQFSNNELNLFTDLLPDLQKRREDIISTKFTPPELPTVEPEVVEESQSTVTGSTNGSTPRQSNSELVQQLIELGTTGGGSGEVIVIDLKAGNSTARVLGDKFTTEPFLEELRVIKGVT